MNMSRRRFALLAGAGLLAGCARPQQGATTPNASSPSATGPTSTDGHVRFLDLHCDTVDQLGMLAYEPYASDGDVCTGTLASNSCEVSVDRMGSVRWAQCYAIWLPDEEPELSHHAWYQTGAAYFKQQMEDCADTMAQARSASEIEEILDAGKVAAILTVENAACLDAGIQVVDEFAEDGVLIAGITWNGKNALGSGNDTTEGLTKLGRSYLAALEDHGIVADVSHLNETGFWEVEKLATKPYIATHSNARALCDVPRNLTDEQFRAIRERGGLVGLNLHKDFVHAKDNALYDFDLLCAHVEHWLDLGGADVIAFGTDRDGAHIPSWLAHCSSQEYLYSLFVQRLGEEQADKLFFDNALAFLRRYEELA